MTEKFRPPPVKTGLTPPPKKKPPNKKTIVLPPAGSYTPPAKGHSQASALTALGKKYPYYAQFIPLITNAATQWTIDPVQLMQVLIWEGHKAGQTNSAGAKGLAAIADSAVDPTLNKTRYNEFIQQYGGFDPFNPTWAINYMAWRMDGGIRHYPTLDDWYRGSNGDKSAPRGYNPGFTGDSRGPGPSAVTKKAGGSAAAYTPVIPQSPTQTGGKSSTTSAATQAFKDPYVVGVAANGNLITKFSDTVPKNAILFDGSPMTASVFKSLARSLDSYFVSYTGGRPSNKMVLNYVNKGWSPYTLTVALSQNKNFTKSPIYKKMAPEYQDQVKNILGPGENVNNIRGAPTKQNAKGNLLIKSAIVNGWDSQTFAAVLRQRPQYVQSNEFKGNTATLLNVHSSIMGVPDAGAMNTVKQAALAGWSADQYAAYLRAQPTYTQSPEYQSKTLSFLGSLGLITGENPVLKKGTSTEPNPNPKGFGPIPNDKRLPAGQLSAPEDTVATYNG